MTTISKATQIKIIIKFVIVAIIISVVIIYKDQLFNLNSNLTDSERFFKDYNQVPVENVFKYVSVKESIELFSSDNAVIFFGFKECKWCQSYAPMLDEFAKQNSIDKIYYCDIKQDRANNTEEYKALVQMLEKYLYEDDNNNKRIYVPDVYFVKDGKIIGHNNDTSIETGADVENYYNENGDKLKNALKELFSKVKVNCNDSGKGC